MRKAWIGVAFLSASWLVGLDYYHQPNMIAWAVLVLLGATVFQVGALTRRPSAGAAIIAAILLLPAVWLLGWPWRTGPALLAAGLLLAGLPVARDWLRRVGAPLIAAGIVLTAQAMAICAYAGLTARSHDLPMPLARAVAYVVGLLHAGSDEPLALARRLMGHGLPLGDGNLAVQAGGAVHNIGATWELLLDPATVCFLAAAAAIIAMRAWQSAAGWRGLLAGCGMFVRLAVATALWLPLRAALMIGIFCHRAMLATGYPGSDAGVAGTLLSPWLHLALLAGPVLLAWRVGRYSRPAQPPLAETASGGKCEPRVGGLAVFGMILAALAAVAVTAAVIWDPPGRVKPGRILWDEYHSQQPGQGKVFDPTATDRPLDTEWYGPAAANNWACIYDYVSRFHECSRVKEPLTDLALREADVLVIKVPSKALAPEELSAVERFIERGGGVLMVGDGSNRYGSAYALGALAWRLGCEIRHDVAMPIDPSRSRGAPMGPRHIGRALDEFIAGFGRFQPLAPHPIMQYAGGVDLAEPSGNGGVEGAEGATIRFTTGRAVVLGTGLKSIPTVYSSIGPRPGNPNGPDIRCGAFAQIWAGRRGAGRVVANADASIFSNVSAFQPHRRELMLGMLDWLNRENTFPNPQPVMALIAAGLALLALAATRPMHKAWPLAVGAAALGWAAAIVAVPAWNRAEVPPPKPARPIVQIAIDTGISDIRLPQDGVDPASYGPAREQCAFGQFERSILRLGYFPRRGAEAGLLGDAFTGEPNAIVVIRPVGAVTNNHRRMIARYVEAGGTLLVMDSPDDRSTANRLLEPFGLSFSMDRRPVSGITVGGDLPSLRVSQAWAVKGGAPLVSLAPPAGSYATSMPEPAVVAAVAARGKGHVIAVGFASNFSDAEMGAAPDVVPNAQQRKVFDFEFALLRQIIEARPPSPPTPAPPTAPATAPASATAPAPALPAPAGPGNVATGGVESRRDATKPVEEGASLIPLAPRGAKEHFLRPSRGGHVKRSPSTGFAALHPRLQSFAPAGRMGLWLLNADKTTPTPPALAEATAGGLLQRLAKP